MQTITVSDIQQAFPHPIRPGTGTRGYSVGGAVVRFARATQGHEMRDCDRFPDEWALAEALVTLAPGLTMYEAVASAEIITGLSADGDFDWAWSELQEVLEVGCAY